MRVEIVKVLQHGLAVVSLGVVHLTAIRAAHLGPRRRAGHAHLIQERLVVGRPGPHRQLRNRHDLLRVIKRVETLRLPHAVRDQLNRTLEPEPPRPHRQTLQRGPTPLQAIPQKPHHLLGIMGRNVRAETSANANTAIDHEQRHDRKIRLGLHNQPVVVNVFQDRRILLAQNGIYDVLQMGMDIPAGCRVLAALKTRAELALGCEQIDVVRPHELLGHGSDRPRQRRLTVVVGRVL